jgi:3-oxoacyl-[acyl-carrier-protein] synthase II
VQRIVVTGLGAITPIGNDVDTFWKNIVNGVSGVGPIQGFDASALDVRIAAEVKDFVPKDHMDAKKARRMDRFSQFAVAATGEALRDAGIEIDPEDSDRVAVMMNTGGGGIPTLTREVINFYSKGPERVSPFFIPLFAPNMAAAQVSLSYGIHGPTMAAVAACAAGAQAFIDAIHLLHRDEADFVIAGGTEAGLDPVAISAFSNMHALSKRNDAPEQASRPFDTGRDGFVFGEGCGVMIVETEKRARARGANIYCEIAGGAMTADAFHITAPDPDGRGAKMAIKLALERSKMNPEDIDAICAHATSTPLGDIAETKAVKAALGERASEIVMSAPKSMIGHLVGASGAVNGIIAVKAIQHQVMPPTINIDDQDPECDLDYIANEARELKIDAVLSNAFGFGGQNVVNIFKRYDG